MEKNDKKIKTAYATIMILIAVIIVLCGLVLYDKFFKVENYEVNKSDKKNIQKEEENIKMHKEGNLYKDASSEEEVCKTNSKSPYKKGTIYNCNNLGDGKSYKFYVLNDAEDDGRVNLIMDRDYSSASFSEPSTEEDGIENANLGPLNAIKHLPKTSTWTNVSDVGMFNNINYSGYAARLPMASEVAASCLVTNFSSLDAAKSYDLTSSNCSYLWDNIQNESYFGYYTSTTASGKLAWTVDINASSILLDARNAGFVIGIRPVITLSK